MSDTEKLNVYVKRLQVCYTCDHLDNESKSCDKCGCLMLKKVKQDDAFCPLNKWGTMQSPNNGLPIYIKPLP